MLSISDPQRGLDLDVALALRLSAHGRLQRAHGQPDPEVLAAGQSYDGPEHWTRPLNDEQRASASLSAYMALLEREREH